jgi:site-specific recombinase XerC
MLDDYAEALRSSPLSDQTRRTYASKVRQYLAWLAAADLDQDPLTSADSRDWAVRDYRTRALDARAQLRYLRAVQACPSPRDQALALVPFYAGARISEIVAGFQ